MDKLTLRHCQVPPDHYDKEIKNNFLLRIWHQSRFRELKKILPEQENPGFKILDIGCHGGTATEVVSKKFPHSPVFALDISAQAIQYGRKVRPHIHFLVGKATALPFPDKNFALVTCFDILEHIPESELALSEIHRVLADKGILILEIPTENFLFKIVWFFWNHFGGGRVWQETHVQDFSGHKLARLLKKSGFEIEQEKTINYKMLFLVRARKS